VMAYSAYLMRILLVLLLMVPISCCFYYLYHAKFKFAPLPAFVAAVLPNILPYQDEIPAVLIRSYSVHGLFLCVLALLLGIATWKNLRRSSGPGCPLGLSATSFLRS